MAASPIRTSSSTPLSIPTSVAQAVCSRNDGLASVQVLRLRRWHEPRVRADCGDDSDAAHRRECRVAVIVEARNQCRPEQALLSQAADAGKFGGVSRQNHDGLTRSNKKTLLLFVHGFNVKFANAALRTAQLAHDLKFPGVAMFYSWPSQGDTSAYLHDEEAAQISESFFNRLLDEIEPLGFDAIQPRGRTPDAIAEAGVSPGRRASARSFRRRWR